MVPVAGGWWCGYSELGEVVAMYSVLKMRLVHTRVVTAYVTMVTPPNPARVPVGGCPALLGLASQAFSQLD